MNPFIEDFINTITRRDTNRLMTYVVPRFIIVGIIIRALTFLGPLGMLIALVVIAVIVY